jgi:putative transposase
LFGKSRQAYYQKHAFIEERNKEAILVLDFVAIIRREIPGLGTHKLHRLLRCSLQSSGIKMGRDKLHELLRDNGLLITKKRKHPKTTDSRHWMKKYPNLIREMEINAPEQVWVCDLTYICVGFDFNYLSLITDAYSKKIVGYHLHPYLTTEGCLMALNMALLTRSGNTNLIHHSDRGSQYCSYEYVFKLHEAGIAISMTENGDAYENAIAERVNGILKTDFKLNRIFKTHLEAKLTVQNSISNYNTLRPHMSCSYLTPEQAHQSTELLTKKWKNNKSKYFLTQPSLE